MSGECCLGFIYFGYFDLIITRESIHKGEEHVGSGIIDQCIDMWQWEIVLGAGPVQISIINTHVYFPVFLKHGNNVGDPI